MTSTGNAEKGAARQSQGPCRIEDMVVQSTKRKLTAPDWKGFLVISDLIIKDPVLAQAAVKAIRQCLKSSKFSSSSPFPPQTPLYSLCLIGVLMRNAWFFIQPFHESDILDKIFLRKLSKRTTHPDLKSKMLSLMRTWSNCYRESTVFTRFFIVYQSALSSSDQL